MEIVAPLVLLFSHEPVADAGRRGVHGRASTCSSSRRSRWRCRWNGTCCSPTPRSSCSSASRAGTATPSRDMSSPWLTVVIVAGAAVLPDPGQPPAGQGVVPARRCASTPATGRRRYGRSPRAPRQKLNKVTRSAGNQVDQFVAFGYEPQWAEITMQQTIAWRSHAQPGPRPVLGAAEDTCPDIDTRTVREARVRLQLADRLQLRRRPPAQRGPDRRGAGARPSSNRASWSSSGSSRRPAAARSSTTRSSTRRSA